jgi:hypothetical protein
LRSLCWNTSPLRRLFSKRKRYRLNVLSLIKSKCGKIEQLCPETKRDAGLQRPALRKNPHA